MNGLMMQQPLLISSLLVHAERHHGEQEVVQSVLSTTLSSVASPPQPMGEFGGFVTAARVMPVRMTLTG